MRLKILAAALWFGVVAAPAPALAQFSVSIGINLPALPQLQLVPGYPVYYAPQLGKNYFFYDGAYWVYEDDRWYASDWYNGPWRGVDPEFVPLYVLRVPVRYYRAPPPYFRGWRTDAPPRWGDHWGSQWSQQHRGWDQWDRRSAPTPAPLPSYQRQYGADRYPQAAQQPDLHSRNYRYQARDPVVRQQFQNHDAPQPHQEQQPQAQHPHQPWPQAQSDRRPDAPPRAAPTQEQAPPTPRADRGEPERQQRTSPERGRGNGPDRDHGNGPDKDREGRPDRGK